jgi:hypothetical protein
VNARLVWNAGLYRSLRTYSSFWLVKRKYTVALIVNPWVEWISPDRKYPPLSLSEILLVFRQSAKNAVRITSAIGTATAGKRAPSLLAKAVSTLAIRVSPVFIEVIPNPD